MTVCRRLLPMACALVMISACTTTSQTGTSREAQSQLNVPGANGEPGAALYRPLGSSATNVSVRDEMWIGGAAIRVSDRAALPDFFRRPVSFYQMEPVRFDDIIFRLSSEFGTRIVVSSDAAAYLRKIDEASSAITGTPTSAATYTLQHNGSVSSLLDHFTDKVGLFWKWDQTHITIYRQTTKTLLVDALPGHSGLSDPSRSPVMESAVYSPWEGIAQAIASMVSSDGRFSLSQNIGSVTITDTPDAINDISRYIESLNSSLDQQIAVRTEVYQVTLERDGSLSIDWSEEPNSPYADIAQTHLQGGSVGLLPAKFNSEGVPYSPSQGLVELLSRHTDISLVTSSSVYTVNGQAVPVQVVNETSYLTQSAGGKSESALITDGVSMSLLPRVSSDGSIMLRVAMDVAELSDMSTIRSNGAKVQLPQRSSKNFMQQASVRSGETMLIAGLEHPGQAQKSRSGRPVMSVILITPYLMGQ